MRSLAGQAGAGVSRHPGVGWGQQALQSARLFARGVFGCAPGGGGGPAAASPGVTGTAGGMAGKSCITEQPPHPQGLHPALLQALLLLIALSCACRSLSAKCAGNLSYYTKIVVILHTPGTYILFLMTSLSSF